MAGTTAIEWCDATFNPWWGCEKVSPGCAHCYAEGVSNHRAGRGLWGADHGFRFFGDAHWAEPLRWARRLPGKLGRRPRVFCASMADVFEERGELDADRARLFRLIRATPELDWLVLTKRPEHAREFLALLAHGWPKLTWPLPNVWLGVSIENARFTWRADVLREIPAAVRFVSAEPLLGSLVTLRRAHRLPPLLDPRNAATPLDLTGIDWLIVGGESGAKARPMQLEWARELVAACEKHAEPAVFVKQLGARPITLDGVQVRLRDRKGGDPDEWPPDLRVREHPVSQLAVAA